MILQLEGYNSECLSIFCREPLKQISSGDHAWEDAVPPEVAEIIRLRGFFGYER
jgi:hypothetical protein